MSADRDLLRYLEGDVTAGEGEAIERRLAADPALARRLDTMRRVATAARTAAAGTDEIDLVPALRARRRAPAPLPHGRWRGAALAVAAAAALVLAVTWRPGDPALDTGFRAKGAGPAPDRWVALEVYRVPAETPRARPRRLGASLGADDGLVFAYENAGERPYSHLAVFAVTGGGEVLWYYPAYTDPSRDPGSVSIEVTGSRPAPLPDLVHHDYPDGAIAICGLFTREPVRVSEVEAAVEELVASGRWDAAKPPRIPVPRSGQAVVTTKVKP